MTFPDLLLDSSGAAKLGAPLALLLGAQAQRAPTRDALTLPDAQLTRLDLDRRSNQRARQLERAGAGHDDIVLIAIPNSAAYYEFVYGAWKLGATPMHVSHKLTPREFAEIVALAEPKLVIDATSPLLDRQRDSRSDAPLPLRIATRWKISTSGGSTGRPKLIVDPNPALWSIEKQAHRRHPDATIINPGPLYHSAPFGQMIPALCEGAHVVEMGKFDAERYIALVARHRATWAYLVPTMMARIANLPPETRARYDISSLDTVVHMAAICPPPVKRAWIAMLGADAIWEIYGGTERIGSTIIGGADWLDRPGSVGRPREGIEARVLDEHGSELPPDAVGEIYFRRAGGPESTFRYIGADVRQRGDWASFGDLGWLDQDGYLFIADRRTDMIVSGGVNLYPAEIEAQIDAIPGIADSVVVGAPHADLGAVPHAFVQVREASKWSEMRLLNALRERLAPYKLPRGATFIEESIRDDSGKIRRVAWRDRLIAQSS
ncbi:AMP-binding protein [Terricaulis silvestris]|uniref:Long-chain-fatty-acid--CoA ligase FadD13 n=1 Tax=Terricaulis silvestris TaxID=2686094 RepID=A0A6I6MTW6_9CAUL|nr:AMP-binding protein [Terricaulis silvestris]QGZ96217.1 Long-chain-fatty-acid--CoA ligase FadD13 [Terricaulis silvestris]